MTKIIHISDIHIYDKNYDNILYAVECLIKEIKNIEGVKIIIITGDVFEHKTNITPNDISVFNTFMNHLAKYQTIVIPGHHDTDIIAELTKNRKNIQYIDETSVININDIEFHLFNNKEIPEYTKNSNKKVAVIHQINEDPQIIDVLSQRYDIVCLGYHHTYKFLKSNVGSSGSLTQCYKSDGTTHGFITWDLETKMGVFKALEQYSLYLTLEAYNNTCNLPDYTSKIRYITLKHTCTPAYLDMLVKRIFIKYRREPDVILNQNNRVIDFESFVDYKKQNHDEILNTGHIGIIKYLTKKMRYSDDTADKLIELHKNNLRKYKIYKKNNNIWTLEFLSWENILCYGRDKECNFINFKRLQNMVGLLGRNKTGKSAVIDILALILFNKQLRGDREFVINKNQKHAWIKCGFSIQADQYVIERTFIPTKGKTVVNLYKNNNIIEAKDIYETYDFIYDLIGTYKDFENLGLAIQNRKFLIDMDSKERLMYISRHLGLDIFEDIDIRMRQKLKELQVKAKVNPEIIHEEKDIDNLNEERSKLESQIEALKYEKNELQLEKEFELKDYSTLNDAETLYIKVDVAKHDLAKLQKPEKPHSVNKTDLLKSKEKILTEKSRLEGCIVKNKINVSSYQWSDFAEINGLVEEDIKQELDEQLSQFNKLEYPKRQIEMKLEEIETKKQQKKMLLEQFSLNGQSCTQLRYKIEDIEHKIKQNEVILNGINEELYVPDINPDEKNKLQAELKDDLTWLTPTIKTTIDEFKKHLYKPDCESCQINKSSTQIIVDKLLTIMDKSIDIQHNNKIINSKLQEIENNLEEYQRVLLINETFRENSKLIKKCSAMKKLLEFVENVDSAEYIYLKPLIKKNQKYLNLFKCREVYIIKKKIKELKSELFKIDEQISNIEHYNKYMELKEFIDKNSKIVDNNKQAFIKNKQITKNVKDINAKIANINEKIKYREQLLAEVLKEIGKVENIMKLNEKSNYNKKTILPEINLIKKYLKIISYRTGIPSLMLNKACSIINKRINNLLINLADFQMEFLYDQGGIKVFTNDRALVIPATMGSGYQKFVIDLCLRIAMVDISKTSRSNFLIIDEGFGCLDKENFDELNRLLHFMKTQYKMILIISHIPELQESMDYKIIIQRKLINTKMYSLIQYGRYIEEFEYLVNSDEKQETKKSKSQKSDTLPMGKKEDIVLDKTKKEFECLVCKKKLKYKGKSWERHIASKSHRQKLHKG